MKRMGLAMFGSAVICAVVLGIAVSAHAGKYSQPVYNPPQENELITATPEQVTSMTDCMAYSARHVSKGVAADKEMFKKEYGEPIGTSGSTTEYNYDKYTKIILDCSKKSCNCRCMQKQ